MPSDHARFSGYLLAVSIVTLTPREADVIGLRARGLTNAETAVLLGISEHTVKSHTREARLSLGAKNTAHAVAIALRHRLIVG